MKLEEMLEQAREDYKKGRVIAEEELWKRLATTNEKLDKIKKNGQ